MFTSAEPHEAKRSIISAVSDPSHAVSPATSMPSIFASPFRIFLTSLSFFPSLVGYLFLHAIISFPSIPCFLCVDYSYDIFEISASFSDLFTPYRNWIRGFNIRTSPPKKDTPPPIHQATTIIATAGITLLRSISWNRALRNPDSRDERQLLASPICLQISSWSSGCGDILGQRHN